MKDVDVILVIAVLSAVLVVIGCNRPNPHTTAEPKPLDPTCPQYAKTSKPSANSSSKAPSAGPTAPSLITCRPADAFEKTYADYAVSGLYQGYLDITFFAVFPPALQRRDLKVPILFNYGAFRFEAWLAGRNRKVQRHYWELFQGSRWPEYRVVTPGPGVDSIVECDLAEDFDLSAPEPLTSRIERAAAAFIYDIERYLDEHDPWEEPPPRRKARR